MHGRHHQWQPWAFDELTSLYADPEISAEERLGGGGAQADQDVRLDDGDLGIEPGPAGADFGRVRFLVKPALALRLPLEMLDSVRDVDLGPIDSRGAQRFIQQPPRRTHKGFAFDVFPVARLLADEHHPRMSGTLAKDRLGAGLVQVACLASSGGCLQTGQGGLLRY